MRSLHFRPTNDHDAMLEAWASHAMSLPFSPERLGLTTVRLRYKDEVLTLKALLKGTYGDTYHRDMSWSQPLQPEGLKFSDHFTVYYTRPEGYVVASPRQDGSLVPEFAGLPVGDELLTATGRLLYLRHMSRRHENWLAGIRWQLVRAGVLEHHPGSKVRADRWFVSRSVFQVSLRVAPPEHSAVIGPMGVVFLALTPEPKWRRYALVSQIPLRMNDNRLLEDLAAEIRLGRDRLEAELLAEALA